MPCRLIGSDAIIERNQSLFKRVFVCYLMMRMREDNPFLICRGIDEIYAYIIIGHNLIPFHKHPVKAFLAIESYKRYVVL
jgi:hypothetical protein